MDATTRLESIMQQYVEANEYTNHQLEAELIAAVVATPDVF